MSLEQNTASDLTPCSSTRLADVPVPKDATDKRDDPTILTTAGSIMIASYAIALSLAAFSFSASSHALFAIGVCLFYGAMYFGIPVLVSGLRATFSTGDAGVADADVAKGIDTYSGKLDRFEAVVQMTIVPIAMLLAFTGFAVVLAVIDK